MSATESRARLLPPLLGLAALLAFVAPVLSPSAQLYYRDTARLYYPVKLYVAQALAQGRLALWDTMTESGVSLLGQVTPGLLHPFTLLYAVLPFDLCFKLNHLLGLLLAGTGAYRLSRRLGTSRWAALSAALAYGGCGYLVSMTASNLPYSLGAGTVPIAIDALVGFLERGRIARLSWAAAALALCAYAGEPQAMVVAALIGGGWAVARGGGRARLRGAIEGAIYSALWAAVALCLAAPVALTARAQLERSVRAHLTEEERLAFANHPARLLGLLVPRAFDDVPERADEGGRPFFPEYFSDSGAAFADSIVVGAPALLLAAVGAFAGRRGALLFAGGVVFALASTGEALGIERALFAPVPGAGFFRYAEKLVAPAALLFALAAGLGADRALGSARRAAVWLAAGAAALAGACAGTAFLAARSGPRSAERLVLWGKMHDPRLPPIFLEQLRLGLQDAAALAAAVALVALLRTLRREGNLAVLGAACCAASVFASSAGLLYTAPLEYVRGPFDLAQILERRAGPSPGRWRLFVNQATPAQFSGLPPRVSATVGLAQGLFPQFDSTAGIEGIAVYFSAPDLAYNRAVAREPEVFFSLFGVRFAVEMPLAFSQASARARGFEKIGFGYWVREYPVGSRAFLVPRARPAATLEEALEALSAPAFDPRREAVVRGPRVPLPEGPRADRPLPAQLDRISGEHMRVTASAAGPSLLVVGEHFDPGWRATVDGAPAPALEVDLAAIGVPLPPGRHTVDLRFWPVGLTAGLWVLGTSASALAAAAVWARRKRLTDPVSARTEHVIGRGAIPLKHPD